MDVHLHRVSKNKDLADFLLAHEKVERGPLDLSSLPDVLKDQLKPIFEPGVHLGLDGDDIVFMVRIGCVNHCPIVFHQCADFIGHGAISQTRSGGSCSQPCSH